MAATADDDDYEVIYENSPLYWSMVDAGLEKVGEEDVHKNIDTSSMCTELHTTTCNKQSQWSECASWFSHVAAPSALKCAFNAELRDMNLRVFKMLAGSSLLTEEDALFLDDLMASQQWYAPQAPALLTRKMLALLTAATTCLLVFTFSPWLSLPPWITIAFNTLLVFVIPALVVQALAAWRSRGARRTSEAFLRRIQGVLTAATKSMAVSAKCVRFIQESELVARGFTFVGSGATARVLNELQITSRQRQCPALREKLFITSRAIFFTLRHSFSQLISVCPVNVELSGVMRYCSEIPLSQYPQMLQLNSTDREALADLHEMTEGFSIDVLKSMQELNRIHVSEFLRRLAVCFVPDVADSGLPKSLSPILDAMRDGLETALKNLQSHLDAHRHGPLSASMRAQKPAAWQPVSSIGQLRQTYTAVHSLELHLLAALKRIQDLSQTMERRMDEESQDLSQTMERRMDEESQDLSQTMERRMDEESQDSSQTTERRMDEASRAGCKQPTAEVEVDDSCREAWNQMLSMVKSELSACTGCLEEGVKLLQKKTSTEPLLPWTLAQQPSPAKGVETKVVKLSAEDNPIILDEVFEAYSEPQESAGWCGHSEFTSNEEEAWRRKQKRDLKLCLHELQSIIDVRAAERQERERIAMARMKSASAGTDSHLPEREGCEGETEDGRGTPVKVKHSLEEEPDRGIVNRSCGEEPEESVDDLAKDIEDRVEFWKQFNQRELFAAASEEKNDERNGDGRGGKNERSVSSCETHNLETGTAPCQVTVSTSQIPSCPMLSTVPGSADDQSNSVLTQITPDNEADEMDTIQRLSGTSQSLEIQTESRAQDMGLQRLSTDPSAANNSFLISNSDDDDCEAGDRQEPEGIAEHLSLAAAPSPFAFSVASMVASRARNFAQTEDTFGDSSSEEDEDEDEKENEADDEKEDDDEQEKDDDDKDLKEDKDKSVS